MYTHTKKKINKILKRVVNFVQKNLVQIVVVGGIFVLLQAVKSFPYINIIPNYQFLVIGLTLFLAVLIFKILIPNRNIVIAILILFGIATVTTIFELELISELIGFIIFILLCVTLRQVIRDRKEFKKETDE
jgi:hypothetical protein